MSCSECGAPLAHDQRYCVECGARCRALPPAIAALMGVTTVVRAAPDAAAAAGAGAADSERTSWFESFSMPSPRAAAVAVLGLLAFGVVVGSSVATQSSA